jgi:hypothetical protein
MTSSQRWRKSVAAIDFAMALSRLLRDGSLRDAFAADPIRLTRGLGVSDDAFQALVSLSPAELEIQANVLLRKRFDEVRRLLPVTCSRIGKVAWSSFKEYARRHWPQQVPMVLSDAQAFCVFLRVHNPQALCRSEANRVVFAGSDKRFSLSLVPDLPRREQTHFGIQLLLRSGRHGWRELAICFCP